MLNLADYNSFSDSFSDYLKTIDHLNLKLLMFCRHTTSFKTSIFKFRILNFLDFPPCKGDLTNCIKNCFILHFSSQEENLR